MQRNENECELKGENVYVTWFCVLPITDEHWTEDLAA